MNVNHRGRGPGPFNDNETSLWISQSNTSIAESCIHVGQRCPCRSKFLSREEEEEEEKIDVLGLGRRADQIFPRSLSQEEDRASFTYKEERSRIAKDPHPPGRLLKSFEPCERTQDE